MEEIINAFGVDLRLIVIQILNFGLLLAALWYFLYTPILKILNDRQKTIEKGVEDAKESERRLEDADSEKQSILTSAHNEAEEIVARAKTHAEKEREATLARTAEKEEKILSDAEARAEEMKHSAERESEAEIAKLAVLAAEKVLSGDKK